jgi:hypothetical protein
LKESFPTPSIPEQVSQEKQEVSPKEMKPENAALMQEQIWDATGVGPKVYHENKQSMEQTEENLLSDLSDEQRVIRQNIIEGTKKGQAVNLDRAIEKILTPEERDFWNSCIEKVAFSEGPVTPADAKRFEYLGIRLGLKQPDDLLVHPQAASESLSLKQEAEQLVENQKDFVASKELISPSLYTGRNIDDVAAVIAGKKPAAIIHKDDIREDVVPELFKLAQEKGYSIREDIGFGNQKRYIVGKQENVERIVNFSQHYVKHNFTDENYHWMLGRLLGYPEEAIKEWLVKWRDMQEKQKQEHGTSGQ